MENKDIELSGCSWCAKNVIEQPPKELRTLLLCSKNCLEDKKTWFNGRKEILKELQEQINELITSPLEIEPQEIGISKESVLSLLNKKLEEDNSWKNRHGEIK